MIEDRYIYLLSSKKDYEEALKTNVLTRDSLQSEGFIHASPKNQLTRVANKHYKDVSELLVLVVELKKVSVVVRSNSRYYVVVALVVRSNSRYYVVVALVVRSNSSTSST